MQAAILSAGLGTRLSPHFKGLSKPLIPVAGMPLIEFQLRSIEYSGFDRVAIVLRSEYRKVADHVLSLDLKLKVEMIFRDTCGGAYSLFALSEVLRCEPDFYLFSVDSVFVPKTLKEFVDFRRGKTTPEIVTWIRRRTNQELDYVGVLTSDTQIVSLGKHITACDYIAEGPFHCQSCILDEDVIRRAQLNGIIRLSDYFAYLVSSGTTAGSYLVAAVLDVDTPSDIRGAELLLSGEVDCLQ